MTSEDSVRKLIRTLRKHSKFEGSDLALLHKQQAEIGSAIWSFALVGFVGGGLLSSAHLGIAPIVIFLCGFAIVAFYAYRFAVCSSAASFLISRNTFDLA